jgi:hypothetical protein
MNPYIEFRQKNYNPDVVSQLYRALVFTSSTDAQNLSFSYGLHYNEFTFNILAYREEQRAAQVLA